MRARGRPPGPAAWAAAAIATTVMLACGATPATIGPATTTCAPATADPLDLVAFGPPGHVVRVPRLAREGHRLVSGAVC